MTRFQAWSRLGKAEWIVLRPETKTDRMRTIPVSERLTKLLKRRRIGSANKEHKHDAYVFGNALGKRLDSIKTAWRACDERRSGTGEALLSGFTSACGWRTTLDGTVRPIAGIT
jgi:integrase